MPFGPFLAASQARLSAGRLLAGLLVVLAPAAALAQDQADAGDPSTPARAHVASVLLHELDQAGGGVQPGITPQLARLSAHPLAPGRVVLRLDSDTDPATQQAIQATGAIIRFASDRWHEVGVEATLAQVMALASTPGVAGVRLARRPWMRGQPGTYVNQADGVIHTDQLRTSYATAGAGRTIGIISDSINQTSFMQPGSQSLAVPSVLTGTPPQASGNLPASIQVVNYGSSTDGDTDEGESMMEEAFHLAQGAGFAFGACGDFDTTMATTISQLQSECGASVIGDDVGFADEPMFQDGPIAQAAETFVVTHGGVYASAAGNDDDQGIIMPYACVIPGENDPQTNGTPNAKDLHNWGIGGATPAFLPIVVPEQTSLEVVLEWNQPYNSWSLGAGAQSDFDLYLTTGPNFTNIVSIGGTDQQGTIGAPSGDPNEIVDYNNVTNSDQTIYVSVDHVRGLQSNLLRLEFHDEGGYVTSPFYSTVFGAGTTFGHPTAIDVLGVAAVDEGSPSLPEPFTSFGGWGAGGLPFFFDASGNTLGGAPVLRSKPDLTAPDGCLVSDPDFVFPGPSGPDGFFGTSGATPHVLAGAELAWTERPGLTNFQIMNALRGTSADITTLPASTGPDGWTGFGLVNAYAAAGVPVTGIASSSGPGTYEVGTISLQVAFSANITVVGTPTLALNTTPARSATYSSGSGTSTLTFTYSPVHGDVSANLAPASLQALTAGGVFLDTTSNQNPADTALPVASPGSLVPEPFSSGAAIAINANGPTVSVAGAPSISNQTAFTFTITFSHAVTSFTISDLQLSGPATAGALTTITPNLSYSLPVTATTPGTSTITLTVPANATTDAAAYGNSAGSGSVVYDTIAPSLVISAPATTLTSGQAMVVSYTFSKPVAGFTIADATITGGSFIGGISGSGANYSGTVGSSTVGTMTISVAAGATHDPAGNALAAPASLQISVVNPPSSKKKCGLGGLFGLVLGLGAWRWRRRPGMRAR